MSIQPSELRWFRSAAISDAAGNGGRMGVVEAISAVKNNVLPDVTLAERASGLLRYRKMFLAVRNAADLVLSNSRVFVQLNTPGADNVTFFAGTQRDTQANIAGTERLYGGGRLNANIALNAVTFQVITEGAALNYLRTGDTIRITDKVTEAGGGNEDFVVATGVSYSGDVATVTIAAPGVPHAFASATSGASSVLEAGDIKATATTPNATTAGGTLPLGAATVVPSSVGSVEQDWTLTFSSATAYSITGDQLGAVGGGNTTSGAAPVNPATGQPYFSLTGAAFGGTWSAGNTITFTTSPAALPIWYRHAVPAASGATAGNKVVLGLSGESA